MSKHRGYNKRKGSKRPSTKMSPRKQSRKTRRKNHDTHTVEIPKRLLKNLKHRQKERKPTPMQ